jgi:hypothetical protein
VQPGTSDSGPRFDVLETNARESRPPCSRAKIYDRTPLVEVMAYRGQDTQPPAPEMSYLQEEVMIATDSVGEHSQQS